MLTIAIPSPGMAGDWNTVVVAPPRAFYYETWVGGDGAGRAVSIYGGMTAALGGDIRAEGFRVRTTAGYGTYGYTRSYSIGPQRAWQDFRGEMTTADLLLGYQLAMGPWILKVFAGASQETHTVVAHGGGNLLADPRNAVQGDRIGFKGAIETWWNIGNIAFVQTDLSWSQPFEAYGGRVRAGYRVTPALSTGAEVGLHGNANHDAGRLGTFLRFEWTAGEVSASGGLAARNDEITGLYGSLGLMLRF